MAPRWDLFAGVAVLVAVAFLALARATSTAFPQSVEPPGPEAAAGPPGREGYAGMDTGTLLANAALSQLLVGLPLVGVAWYAGVPLAALGLDGEPIGALLPGVGVGLAIYLANEAGALAVERLGFEADERLREMLAPDSFAGWGLLLFVVLPVIAGVEEFLFRGALVGAISAGYGLSIWLLAVVSSILFALGHGLQGPGGVLVTGLLGYALAVAFVLTGSLWVVIVAHYVVNALEFLVHEGLGIDVR